jgi:tRNA(fMet)-specific endonuclease VapC
VGLLIDTNVFIQCERWSLPVDVSHWNDSEGVFISAVTVSELLMGVHRADSEPRRRRRSEFVEAILAGVSVLGDENGSGTDCLRVLRRDFKNGLILTNNGS